MLPHEGLINHLRESQVQRVAIVRHYNRTENSCRALARRYLGWQPDLTEAERKKLRTAAERLVKAMIKGKGAPEGQETAFNALLPFFVAVEDAFKGLAAQRKVIEAAMEKAVKTLPVWPWAEGVRGFGALGLAIIVGEAGDLAAYDNPAKLWKRMGVGLVQHPDGTWHAQGKRTNPELAALHGYNPRRRSQLWVIGDSLIKGNKDGYRTLYLGHKAEQMARTDEAKPASKMHAHRRAQRYMEKRLLRDLWAAWNEGQVGGDTQSRRALEDGGHTRCDTQRDEAPVLSAASAPSAPSA